MQKIFQSLISTLELDNRSIFINSNRVGCKNYLILINDNLPHKIVFPLSSHSLYIDINIFDYKFLTCEIKMISQFISLNISYNKMFEIYSFARLTMTFKEKMTRPTVLPKKENGAINYCHRFVLIEA